MTYSTSSLKQRALMGKEVYRRRTCRLCEDVNLELVLQLTPTPPVDAFVSEKEIHVVQDLYPIDVFLCHHCGHVQLLDVVNPKILFGDYLYLTTSSPGLVEHFRRYAESVVRDLSLPLNSSVVEIGSNDGTLLKFFKDKGMRVLGIDPAGEIAKRATESGLPTLPDFFSQRVAHEVRRQYGPAQLVCANNVFAHADDLADMAEGVVHLLDHDGVFVFEVSYLVDTIKGTVFDFIYHEHLCYHSVKPLRLFLRKHGMEIINAVRIPPHGGSIRVFAQRAGGKRPTAPAVGSLSDLESKLGLDDPKVYKDLALKIERIKEELGKLVDDLVKQGKTIAGYGASATTTVLTYHFNLGKTLRFLIDDNPVKQHRFSPGYHLPVFGSQALYDREPDAVILLAWRFSDMILAKQEPYLRQGGHFIIPLPKVRIV